MKGKSLSSHSWQYRGRRNKNKLIIVISSFMSYSRWAQHGKIFTRWRSGGRWREMRVQGWASQVVHLENSRIISRTERQQGWRSGRNEPGGQAGISWRVLSWVEVFELNPEAVWSHYILLKLRFNALGYTLHSGHSNWSVEEWDCKQWNELLRLLPSEKQQRHEDS